MTMTKKVKLTPNKLQGAQANEAVETQTSEVRGKRPERRKVYERVRDAVIPKHVYEHFAKDGYYPKLIRWQVLGMPDFRYLARREREGYEFITKSELPKDYLKSLRLRDTEVGNGLITNGGDLCLMKIDLDLRQSRIEFYHNEAQREQDAVDVNVLERKGLRNVGSKSKVMLREPSFQE